MTPHVDCQGCQTCWAATIDLQAVEGPPPCGRWPECDPSDGSSACAWPNCPPGRGEATPVLPPSGHAEPRTPAPEGHRTPQTPTEALRAPATRPGVAWCWQCIDGHHQPTARWHSWATDEDARKAIARGRSDPRAWRCGCACADAPTPADLGLTRVVETVHLPEEDQ